MKYRQHIYVIYDLPEVEHLWSTSDGWWVDPHGEAMKQHETILKSTLAAALKEHCG